MAPPNLDEIPKTAAYLFFNNLREQILMEFECERTII